MLTPQDQIDRIIEVTRYIRWAFTIMAAACQFAAIAFFVLPS